LRIHGKALASHGTNLKLDSSESQNAVWTITHIRDDLVDVRSNSGHYIGMRSDGEPYLHHGQHDGGDTHFHLEHLGQQGYSGQQQQGQSIALRSKHGPYLSVHDHGGWFSHQDRSNNSVFEEILLG